jgi:hypothetical protein
MLFDNFLKSLEKAEKLIIKNDNKIISILEYLAKLENEFKKELKEIKTEIKKLESKEDERKS